MDETIEMPFGVWCAWTAMGPRNHVLWGQDPSHGKGYCWGHTLRCPDVWAVDTLNVVCKMAARARLQSIKSTFIIREQQRCGLWQHVVQQLDRNSYQASFMATCQSRHNGQYSSDAKLQNSTFSIVYNKQLYICITNLIEPTKTIGACITKSECR